MIRFDIPVKIVSEANLREHWASRNRRAKNQKSAAAVYFRQHCPRVPPFPLTVTLTRMNGRKLDSDNLARAFKAIRDQIASELGVDDGLDELVRWEYKQVPGGRNIYASVTIEPRESTGNDTATTIKTFSGKCRREEQ